MSIPITIRETEKKQDSFAATVQFGPHGAPYEVTVSDPFSENEEKRLEWYFEEWLKFPFTDKVAAEEAASSIRKYGQNLFEQVFRRDPDIYMEYQQLRKEDFLLEIVGSPEFHTLHWEALHDPKQEHPLVMDKLVVRKNSRPVHYEAKVQPAPQLRVLLVSARPGGVRDISYRTISRPLVEAMETGRIPAQIDIVRPATFEALVKHLEDVRDEHGDGYYHIIHLDMHGALLTHQQYTHFVAEHKHNQLVFRGGGYAQEPIKAYEGQRAFLFFDDSDEKQDGTGDSVSADALAGLLNTRQIPIVILNACQSGKQVGAAETSLGSQLLAAGVQLVVAIGYSVTVSAAKLLMTTLYCQLLAGKEPATAIRRARLELYNDKRRRAAFGHEIMLEDWVLPVIYQNRPTSFDRAAFQAQAAVAAPVYVPPRTTYGFVGRDVDILQIERRLLNRRNLLLVRGMGGAGKTTLLHHLGWWWQKTRLVGQVFYFGYDVKAYYLQEIVSRIGQQLGLNLTGIAADDRTAVLHELKSIRHLLILDNLESITGQRLAVKNTLPVKAQGELRAFLQELIGTNSLVLLGSRGGEEWLRPDPLRKIDVYELPGLDYESQTMLAEAIIQGVNAPHYPEMSEHRDDFRRLLKLLGGYPLALEVVLANLAQSTPAEIIERLHAADVDLDNQKETAGKTESILKCVDYSHSNLSDEAQALLLCLAPFTGVINISFLEQYSVQLKAQPALADLPYQHLTEVLQEAVNWGLLQPHEDLAKMGYLRLQPIFPYFLKIRLNDPSQDAQKQAIETAFREHYNDIGGALAQVIQSKEAHERQVGLALIGIEYENLLATLFISLNNRLTFFNVFEPLFRFLLYQKSSDQMESLCKFIIERRSTYSNDQLKGEVGEEFSLINDRLAATFLETKNYKKAADAYKENLDTYYRLEHLPIEQRKKGRASTLHQLGIVAQEQREWAAAEKYYKEALQIKIEFKDRYEQAGTLNQLGIVAQQQRQWAAAEEYYKEVLQIYIEFQDRYSQASTLHQLGTLAQEQREWAAAEKYYKEALQIKIEFQDRYSQASTLHQLGRVAQEQREWAGAEKYYKEALQIKIEFQDCYSQASTLHQLGVVAQEQRELAAAEKYYKEALQIKIEFQDRYSQAFTLGQLGLLAKEREDWTEAVDYLLQSAAIFAEYQDPQLEIALRTLAELHQVVDAGQIVRRLAEALGISNTECEELLDQFGK